MSAKVPNLSIDHKGLPAAGTEPAASHLTNSRAMRWDRIWLGDAGQQLVLRLLADLQASEEQKGARRRARKASDLARLHGAFTAILGDIYAAWGADPDMWLAYPRRREDYGNRRSRYDSPDITYTSAVTVVDYLVDSGWAMHQSGSYQRRPNPFATGEVGAGYRSRLRATPKLISLIEDGFGLGKPDLGYAAWCEVIQLKGPGESGKKSLIEYEDTPETRRMREGLLAINKWLASHQITTVGGSQADQTAVRLYRVFNNADFGQGGRFYGGWWISAKKDVRSKILINVEPTVELDFVGLHPRLLYDLAGEAMRGPPDPYGIPGWDDPELRPVIKVAFNQLLNISGGKTPRAPKGLGELLGKRRYPDLLRAIETRHAPIAQWFRSGRGLELQRLDSDIAEGVLLNLMREGICCLPIHDSFIVPARHADQLKQAMRDSYKRQLLLRTGRECFALVS